jgi:hypothetical protein
MSEKKFNQAFQPSSSKTAKASLAAAQMYAQIFPRSPQGKPNRVLAARSHFSEGEEWAPLVLLLQRLSQR